jgi:predicted Fe-S protein YdhL (DUF1289 family)
MQKNYLASPCVGWCKKNDDDICEGCGRTGEEIADWYLAKDERKKEIIANAEQRIKQVQTELTKVMLKGD